MGQPVRHGRLISQGDSYAIGGPGSWTELHTVNVNSGAANASVAVWGSNPSTADSKFASIAASAVTFQDYAGVRLPGGLFVRLLGGSADVTITHS
jgi:hypothetical protein